MNGESLIHKIDLSSRRHTVTHMSDIMRRLATAALCFTLAACGSAAIEPAQQCLTLTEPEGNKGILTSAPAKVSLFFGVDTCGGEPVAGLDGASFKLTEDGKPLSELESQRMIRARGQKYRMNSLVLLDMSGSVLRSGQFPTLKEAAQRYVQSVLAQKNEGQRVSVVTFDGREKPTTLIGFSDDVAAVQQSIASLETKECDTNAQCAGFTDRRTCAGWRCVDDSTNLNGAVLNAIETLETQTALEASIPWKDSSLIIFTDGSDQAARVSSAQMLDKTRLTRSHIFSIGLGGEVDQPTLTVLGKDGFWPAAKASELGEAFEAIAKRVTGLANRFYLLEYCSPKRSGIHTLKVTATFKKPDGTELIGGLSRDFDASGFGSGCSVE